MKKLNAKLSKAQADLRKAEASHVAEMKEMQTKLVWIEAQQSVTASKRANAQVDPNDAFKRFGPLLRSKADRADGSPRFRGTRISDSPSRFMFDFMRTFDVSPRWSDATIAYMRINEKHYFAKNGDDHDIHDGFISGTTYTKEASQLFRPLGFEHNKSYFVHAEPQLMALFVKHFRDSIGLDLKQFVARQPVTLSTRDDVPRTVEIFTSKAPCSKCKDLERIANLAAGCFNFRFSLIYASCP
jgi:hypothetical protein